MKITAFACLTALALTGCAAPTTAPVAAATTPPLPPHAKAVEPALIRHVLGDQQSSTRLWGLQYTDTTPIQVDQGHTACSGPGAEIAYTWRDDWYCLRTTGWNINWSHTGSGTFEAVGHPFGNPDDKYTHPPERFIYTVPEDQVLVINEVQGRVTINGFNVSSSSTREKVDYLFGAGEVVMFYLGQGAWLDGFSADPSLLGAGSKSARSAK